jgi:DNA polymerase-3 subunit chi
MSASGPEVVFYLLSAADARARLVTACRLAEKAYDQGRRVALRTTSPAETAELDELLWTYADRSFVPHVVWPAEREAAARTPVLIANGAPPETHRDVLINLGGEAPPDLAAYAKICEIVGTDEPSKRQARTRWRAYREAGCKPESHPL